MDHPAILHIVNAVIALLLFATMLSLGLEQHFRGLVAFWRQPGLVLRALVAVDVLVPLLALVIALGIPGLGQEPRRAILIMAAASSAPLVLRKAVKVRSAASYGGAARHTGRERAVRRFGGPARRPGPLRPNAH
jgi:BASS family bile acid:Na+ symporter